MDPQALVKKHMEEGRFYQSLGELALLIVTLLVAGMLPYGAYQILRNGLNVSASKTVTGPAAKFAAAIAILVALGIAAYGVFIFKTGLPL